MNTDVTYTQLKDGTPVMGRYNEEGVPSYVCVKWSGGVYVSADEDSFSVAINGNIIGQDMRMADWGKIRELMSAGVVEELMPIARRWAKEPLGPPAPPMEWEKNADAMEIWNSIPHDRQRKFRPILNDMMLALYGKSEEECEAWLKEFEAEMLAHNPHFFQLAA